MQTFFTPVLVLHIIAGFTALLTGLAAIIARKGRKFHRANGKIYFWSMLFVAVSAAIMSLMKDLNFFLMLSMFSFYSAYSGFRAIRNKERRATLTDWLMLGGAVVTCGFMILSANIILTVFGVIFGSFLFSDIKQFTSEPLPIKSMNWLLIHIGRMLGAYIATVTAFIVVNFGNYFSGNWNLIAWLGPTVIGIPLISYWINKYKPKKNLAESKPAAILHAENTFMNQHQNIL
jgi:uncharacterized membrane protein